MQVAAPEDAARMLQLLRLLQGVHEAALLFGQGAEDGSGHEGEGRTKKPGLSRLGRCTNVFTF